MTHPVSHAPEVSLLDGVELVLPSSALAALVGIGVPFYLVVSMAQSNDWGMGAIGLALITMTLGVIVGVPGAIALTLRAMGRPFVAATAVLVIPFLATFAALNVVFDRLVWSPHPAIIVPLEAMAAGLIARALAVAWSQRDR
jgi:hypothetical protein